ncbi:hypothetical protein D3C77_688440 [compost metagenome]
MLWARLAVLCCGSAFTTYGWLFTGRTRTTRLGSGRLTSSFTFFGILFGTLCLNARFGFFKLLASMIDMLLFQLTARVTVQVYTLGANFDTVQVTPA